MKHDPNDILDAAVRLIDRDGVGITTTKVAAEAGVSNGTLFHYFPNKQALVDATYQRLKDELVDVVGKPEPDLPLRDQFEHIWLTWGDWVAAHPERQRVIILLREAGLVSESVTAASDERLNFSHLFEQAAESGILVDLPLSYLMASVMAQFETAHSNNLNRDERRTAFDGVWRGLTVPRSHG